MDKALVRKEYYGGTLFTPANRKCYLLSHFGYKLMGEALVSSLDRALMARQWPQGRITVLKSFFESLGILSRDGTLNFQLWGDGHTEMNVLQGPVKGYVEVTNLCNLKCKHCFNDEVRGCGMDVGLDVIESLFEDLKSMGTFQVKITGGEPMLREDLREIIEMSKHFGFYTMLATNGTLIDDKTCLSLISSDIDDIKISLDGPQRVHDSIRGKGSFNRAIRGVSLLMERGFKVRIGMTAMASNVEYVQDVVGIAVNLGVDLGIMVAKPSGLKRSLSGLFPISYEIYKVAIRQVNQKLNEIRSSGIRVKIPYDFLLLEESTSDALCSDLFVQDVQVDSEVFLPAHAVNSFTDCAGGKSTFALDPMGNVYPCGFLGPGYGAMFLCGNIYQQRFFEVWYHSDVFRKLREREPSQNCLVCRHYRRSCDGGCLARAFAATGSLYGVDPICRFEERSN